MRRIFRPAMPHMLGKVAPCERKLSIQKYSRRKLIYKLCSKSNGDKFVVILSRIAQPNEHHFPGIDDG